MKFRYLKNGPVVLLALLIISLGSCKKDSSLNVPSKGILTDAATFSSEGNADLFVNDIYANLPDMNGEDEVLDQFTDNGFVGASWMIGQSVVRSNAMNPTNTPRGPAHSFLWSKVSVNNDNNNGNYDNIRKCNVFLSEVAKNKGNFSAAWYTERVAEVRYLRAFFYSVLFENYGGVPLITTPLDNQTQGDAIFVAKSTIAQTAAFIESECDAAATDLPLKAQNLDRVTKGAALTLKGSVQLFEASPLVNTSNDVTKWAAAATTNLAVMNLGVYNIFTADANTATEPGSSAPYNTAYADQFLAKNNWNSETIFARAYGLPGKGHKREGVVGPVIVHGGEQAWGNLCPTQSLVDDYEMDNGKPITDPTSGYDPTHPYTNREPRFYQSVVYDGSIWQGDTWESRIGGNNQIDLGSSSDISNTGYNGKITLDESINGQVSLAQSPNTSNYIFFRYAEVLLSYAEAQNEAAGPDATVYAAILPIRTRAGLPGLPAGLTQAQMRDAIRRERRIEFAFQDKRWNDIRRWDITTTGPAVLTAAEYGMKITDDGTGNLTYAPIKIFQNSFSEYMNWLPIPQTAIDANPKLTQNPGYH